MLPVYLDIANEAKRVINKNIGRIFDLLKSICEGLSYEEVLDSIYPNYILDIRLEKCIQTVKELYNMTQDNYERDYLEPFYEWTLYFTIVWWKDISDEIELDEVPREYCIDECGMDIYDYVNNIENYVDFLFQDWDFLDLEISYSIYKRNPYILTELLDINMDDYLELMPNDIVKDYKKMRERTESNMKKENNMTFNISGGQVNISKDNSILNATQNNGISGNELDNIIKGVMENIHSLDKEHADMIIDLVELTKEELSRPVPKQSRLKNCLSLIAPMFTIANGIPMLSSNLHKLQELIMQYIK